MEVTGGSLSYTATIDYSQLEAAVKNIESRLATLEGVAESTGEALDNMGNGLKKVLASIGGTAALSAFTKQMFNVRKSFQDTQSVMEVFLGSAEKAEAHLKELQKYAWYNMFDFETLTQASAQLQAFGTDVDNVIPLIDRLSNIAAGTKTDLMSLVESFNRAKSIGTADSRMLRSFATKGLDVVKTLRDMGMAVSDTSVTFEQLMVAVEAATNEGGRFYNLMDSQFNNLSSLAGAVEDDLSIMFNEIGQKLQPTMESILKATHTLIENYETIGRVLASLLATYGAYRTALVTTTIIQNLQAAGIAKLTAMEKVHYAWLVLQEKAQALLNKTMLSNPYVLLATVLVGAVAGLVAYSKATKDTRTAEEKLNDELEERISLHKSLVDEAEGYINTLVNEKENVEALNTAYENLSKLEPFKNMSLEELRGKSVDELKAMLNDWDNTIRQQEVNKSLNDALQKWYVGFSNLKAPISAESGSLSKKAAYNTAMESLPEIYAANKKYIEQQITSFQNLDNAQKKLKYEELIKNLEDMNEQLEASDETAERFGLSMSKNAPLIEMNNQSIGLLRRNLEDLTKSEEVNTFPIFDPKDDRSVVSQIKKAEEEVKRLRTEMMLTGQYTPEMITKIQAAEKNLETSKNLYKTLTGQEYGKSDKTAIQHRRAAEDAELAIIKDSYLKQRKAAKNEAKRKIEDLQRTLKEETNLTAEARSAINSEIAAVRQKMLHDLEEIDKDHTAQVIKNRKELENLDKEQIQDETNWLHEKEEARIALMQDGFAKEISEMQLEHVKRMEAIQKQAEEEAKVYEEAAKKRFLLENQDKTEGDFYAQWSGIPKSEQAKIDQRAAERSASQQAIFAKQEADRLHQMLVDYGDYSAQKEDLDKKYFSDYGIMAAKYITATTDEQRKAYAGMMGEIRKEWASADLNLSLNAIDATVYDTVAERMNAINAAYDKYIEQLRFAGATEAEIAVAKQQQVESAGKLATINEQIASLESQKLVAVNNGDVNEVKRLNEEIRKLQKQLKDLGKTADKESLGTKFKEWADDLKASDIISAAGEVGDVISNIGEAAGNDSVSGFGKALSLAGSIGTKIASGDYLGAALEVIMEIGNAIAEDIAKMNAFEEANKQAAIAAKQLTIDNLLQDKDGIFGGDSVKNLENYTKALEVANKGLGELSVNGGKYFKVLDRSGFINFFGGEDKYSSLAEFARRNGLELHDEYGKINAQVLQLFKDTYSDLSEADQQWIDNAIAYTEQYQEAMEHLASYLSDLFGNVVDSVVDKVFEGATDMEAIVADAGRQMAKDLMKSMITATYFDGLQEKMLKILRTSGGMTEEASAAIFGLFAQAMQNLEADLPQWTALAEKYADMFQFDTEASSIGPGTALASASQESIDLMNGQLNAMRTVQGRIDGTIQNILLELRGFRGDMNTQMNRSNDKLDQIIDNTSTSGLGRSLGAYFG